MKALLVICALALVAIPATQGRTMDRCSLAKEMSKLGVPREQLDKWTCIAQHESSFRTEVVGPANSNGSNDYGIFQINNKWWCQSDNGKVSHNGCKLSCNSLLTEDITNSVRCAQHVLLKQGWKAWSTWKFCKGSLPSINDCF